MSSKYTKDEKINLKVIIALSRLIKSIEAGVTQDFQRVGLTASQFSILETLYHKGEMSINALIEKTLNSSGNITVVIQNLVKAGLVKKRVSPNDKRSRTLGLTTKGNELISVFFPEHVSLVCDLFSGTPNKEKEHLIKLANKLASSIGEKI